MGATRREGPLWTRVITRKPQAEQTKPDRNCKSENKTQYIIYFPCIIHPDKNYLPRPQVHVFNVLIAGENAAYVSLFNE